MRSTPPSFSAGELSTQITLTSLAPVLDKIRKFNAIELPNNYPIATYIYQIEASKLSAADYYLLTGEIDKGKIEYDRRTTELTALDKLNALRYAALSGKNFALKNCASAFKVKINEISLINLFTILHYAALGGNTQLTEQAIEWVHANHQNNNRFRAISSMLYKRIAISLFVSGLATGFVFMGIAISASSGIAPIILFSFLSLTALVINAIACGYSPIQLLCKFPGFGKESRQVLDASAGIALIAAIESDNPQVMQSISSRIIRSYSISYPIPPERSLIPNPYGVVGSVKTQDYFHPSYANYAEHKSETTQVYTKAITSYHSSCLYRQHPEAPQARPSVRETTEHRIFSNPQRQPGLASNRATASPTTLGVIVPVTDTPSFNA